VLLLEGPEEQAEDRVWLGRNLLVTFLASLALYHFTRLEPITEDVRR
jgi:hypothetical protein